MPGPPTLPAGSINITAFGDPVPVAPPLDAPSSVWLLKVHSCLKAWSVNLLDEAYKPERNLCKSRLCLEAGAAPYGDEAAGRGPAPGIPFAPLRNLRMVVRAVSCSPAL